MFESVDGKKYLKKTRSNISKLCYYLTCTKQIIFPFIPIKMCIPCSKANAVPKGCVLSYRFLSKRFDWWDWFSIVNACSVVVWSSVWTCVFQSLECRIVMALKQRLLVMFILGFTIACLYISVWIETLALKNIKPINWILIAHRYIPLIIQFLFVKEQVYLEQEIFFNLPLFFMFITSIVWKKPFGPIIMSAQMIRAEKKKKTVSWFPSFRGAWFWS